MFIQTANRESKNILFKAQIRTKGTKDDNILPMLGQYPVKALYIQNLSIFLFAKAPSNKNIYA